LCPHGYRDRLLVVEPDDTQKRFEALADAILLCAQNHQLNTPPKDRISAMNLEIVRLLDSLLPRELKRGEYDSKKRILAKLIENQWTVCWKMTSDMMRQHVLSALEQFTEE
jgi:hypothetical protein